MRVISLIPALFFITLGCTPARQAGPESSGELEISPENPPDAVEPSVMELYPTWTAVGIEIPYAGDQNGNSQARLFWKHPGDSDWRNGVDFTFDRQRKLAWASIFPLEQGDSVKVLVRFTDPEPGSQGRLEGVTAVRKMLLEPAGGRQLHVSPKGSDLHNPGSHSRPFRTIGRASEAAQAGDIVLVGEGTYHEGGLLAGKAGEPGRPIVVCAEPGEKPVLDGSLEIPAGHKGWKPVAEHAWKTFLPWQFRWHSQSSGDLGYGYLAQDGKRMFCYRHSLDAFLSDSLSASRSWYCDTLHNELYVRTGLADAPEIHTYNFATLPTAFHLAGGRNLVVRGFEIRFYGTAGAVLDRGAQNCILIGNEFHNLPWGVYLEGAGTRDNAIWRNEIRELGLVEF
ncbi:MAG TPA: DUF1565 domain-containing protein, partial [Candidatus Glassbacteria bacterium]|nr:DUF1565 domain-containing protein [Candidatus Glassbacteria bacterium]